MNLSFPKRLPNRLRNRKVIVSTRAYRRYWTHSLDAIHSDIFKAIGDWVRRNDVVWDIGANCGVFTFAAAIQAGISGKVIAIEADLQCAALIERSVRYRVDDEAPVMICPFAISDQDGIATFEVSSYRSAASSLAGFGRFSFGGVMRHVPSFKLDSLRTAYPSPNVVKIDVEGAEHLVLRGAVALLEKDRPVVICECSGGDVGKEIEDIFKAADYLWRPMIEYEYTPFSQCKLSVSDIVALPREHVKCIVNSETVKE
jgi:FkbM family methyltransferase